MMSELLGRHHGGESEGRVVVHVIIVTIGKRRLLFDICIDS